MKRSIYIALLFTFLVVSFSPAAEKPKEKPKLVIEQPIHDAGQVERGAKVEHAFTIKNTGTADLIIRKVVPG